MTWFKMGGYSCYVWPAYGLVVLILVLTFLGIKWQSSRTNKKLQKWFKQG